MYLIQRHFFFNFYDIPQYITVNLLVNSPFIFHPAFSSFLKQFEMFPISSPVRSSTPELHTKGAFSTCSQLHSPYNSPVRHLRPSNGLVSGSTINKLHPFEGYEVHTTRPCFFTLSFIAGISLLPRPVQSAVQYSYQRCSVIWKSYGLQIYGIIYLGGLMTTGIMAGYHIGKMIQSSPAASTDETLQTNSIVLDNQVLLHVIFKVLSSIILANQPVYWTDNQWNVYRSMIIFAGWAILGSFGLKLVLGNLNQKRNDANESVCV